HPRDGGGPARGARGIRLCAFSNARFYKWGVQAASASGPAQDLRRGCDTELAALRRVPNGDDTARGQFSGTEVVSLYGHRWTFQFDTLPGFALAPDRSKDLMVLAAGTAISLLLFAITWSL